jgi:hypothetical protein
MLSKNIPAFSSLIYVLMAHASTTIAVAIHAAAMMAIQEQHATSVNRHLF